MSGQSSIEWTDATWNPTVGCSRVSEGCRHCYAERMAARIANAAMARLREGRELTATQAAYVKVVRWERGGKAPADHEDKALPKWNGRVELIPEKLSEPLRWTKPRRIFVNSMSDLFHEGVSFEAIAAVLGVISAARWHTFQILTKRPEVALRFFAWMKEQRPKLASALVQAGGAWPSTERAVEPVLCMYYANVHYGVELPEDCCAGVPWPLPNLELGTSVEDQPSADERIPRLLQCPAAAHVVSYEPALGPVNFCAVPDTATRPAIFSARYSPLGDLSGIFVGGESGPGARPLDVEWVRSTVRQCREANVPVFVKQLGARPFHGERDGFPHVQGDVTSPLTSPDGFGRYYVTLNDRKGGDMSEWPEDLRIRELPKALTEPKGTPSC